MDILFSRKYSRSRVNIVKISWEHLPRQQCESTIYTEAYWKRINKHFLSRARKNERYFGAIKNITLFDAAVKWRRINKTTGKIKRNRKKKTRTYVSFSPTVFRAIFTHTNVCIVVVPWKNNVTVQSSDSHIENVFRTPYSKFSYHKNVNCGALFDQFYTNLSKWYYFYYILKNFFLTI